MPNIPTFQAGNLALHPTETGVEATAQTARRIGAFSDQAATAEQMLARTTEQLGRDTESLGAYKGNLITGEGARLGSAVADAGNAAVKYIDHQQISQGAAAYAGLMQQATQDWNQRVKNADPNDPTIAAGFMASMEPQLEDFKKSFWSEGAQQWAESHVDALRQHLTEKTSADMSTLAGQAAIVNTQQTINRLSSTVHDDPSSVDFALGALKSSTEGMISTSPNLTAVEAGRVRSEISQKGGESIVKSAAIGYITKTGQVPSWANDPKYAAYVNGAELQQFAKAARTQQHQDANDQRQAIIQKRQLAEMDVHAASNKLFADSVSFEQGGNRAILAPGYFNSALDIVRKNPNAPNAASVAKTMIDWGEAQQRQHAEQVISDQATKSELLSRMSDPSLPTPTKLDILNAENAGKISTKDGVLMRETLTEIEQGPIKDPVFHVTLDAAKERVGETTVADGHERFANFMQGFLPAYLQKKKDGTLPPNALDLKDPNSMISQALKPYELSPYDKMRAHLMKSLGGNVNDIAVPSTPSSGQPAAGAREVPAPLRGIGALEYNSKLNMYRDQATGKKYDASGREVK